MYDGASANLFLQRHKFHVDGMCRHIVRPRGEKGRRKHHEDLTDGKSMETAGSIKLVDAIVLAEMAMTGAMDTIRTFGLVGSALNFAIMSAASSFHRSPRPCTPSGL